MIVLLCFLAVQAHVFTNDLRNNVDFQKLLAYQNRTGVSNELILNYWTMVSEETVEIGRQMRHLRW